MGFAQWMRVIDTISGLVQLTARPRRSEADEPSGGLQTTLGGGGGALGQLETRLAGVVVAALKEAFDRDSARLELERSHIDAERKRAEEALRAELRRQAADRLLSQLRLVAVIAVGALGLSAALGVFLPGMREGLPRILLGGGWLLAIGTLGAAFTAGQQISAWSAEPQNTAAQPPSVAAASASPWLLIAALVLTAASLLTAL
ncbi:MAG TPA: hypothetical protein VFO13_04520 [Arthrobacter sp.]|nr:hypothetical protein [Arthrobacter sp.]